MRLDAMIHLLGIKQLRDPAQVGLDREPLIPPSPLTILDILRWNTFLAKTQIGERNRLAVVASRQRTKHVIRFVGGVPCPVDHFAGIIDQPGQLDADKRATIRFAFLTDLSLAAAFATWMDQLDPVVSSQ